MDFEMKDVEKIDDGHFIMTLVPSPVRYEFREIDEKKGYWDKLDEIFIPLEEMEKMFKNEGGLPIYYSPTQIDNIENYTERRIRELLSERKEDEEYTFIDSSEDFLKGLEVGKMRFVILSLDIKGSTKMSQELSTEQNSQLISLFSSEMSKLIEKFNGYVLKYLGDGIIAYFPEPNYIGMNDNAIDCANCIKYFIEHGLNEVFFEKKLPSLSFRIGLDSGEANVMAIGSPQTKMHKDLIGQTINLATKIQSLAKANQILAGEATIRNAHHSYRKQFIKIDLPKDWEYIKQGTGKKYKIYASVV